MRLLFFVATLVASPAAFAQHDSADLQKVRRGIDGLRAIQAWQIDQARKLAEQQYREDPEDPITLALMAEVKMHMSDYAGAVEYFQRAERAGAPPELLADATLAAAAQVATDGYVEHVGEHFILRFSPGKDAILVPHAMEALDRAREKIGDLLGWKPEGRVVVEIYPSSKTLAQVSTLTEDEIRNSGTIALCRWNRLMITTPRGTFFGYSWRDTLAHELAHLIIGGASENTVPIWLHEGIAKFVETAWSSEPGLGLSADQQLKLKEAAQKKKLIPFEKMHPSMAKLPTHEDTSLAFSEVFTFIEYLVERKGWQGIRQVLKQMARGKSDAQAIEAVFGESLDALEAKWKKTLANRPIKRAAGSVVDAKPILKDKADTPDDKLHGISKKGRRYARAADLLFARGRVKAAQKELEKALAETDSPLISGKLAMIALATGDLDAAEKAARHALEGRQDLAGPSVTLAEILVRREKYAEARAQLERAIDINPFDPRIHRLRMVIAGDDVKEREEAARAMALIEGELRYEKPSLGRGGLIHIEGRPFSRAYLRKEGGGEYVSTGMVTPTNPLGIEPGRFELMLVPPSGAASQHVIVVNEAPEDGSPQTITTGPTGS